MEPVLQRGVACRLGKRGTKAGRASGCWWVNRSFQATHLGALEQLRVRKRP